MTRRIPPFPILLCSVATLGAAFAMGSGGCATSSSDTDAVVTVGSGGAGGSVGGMGGMGGSGGAGGTIASSSSSGAGGDAAGGAGGTGGMLAASSSSGGPNLCGNGVVDPGEACDGQEFDGKTCADYGLAGGSLKCNSFCTVVVSGCTPPEDCTNGDDDDKDGDTDCSDSDCASEPSCTDSCASVGTIKGGDFKFVDTQGKPNTLQGSCSPSNGPEMVYEFTATADADLAIVLEFADFDVDHVLYVRTACGDAMTEIACADDTGAGDDESLSISVVNGQKYYIVVDGVTASDYGSFFIDLTEVKPETSCADNVDNDFDGFIDCADPDACGMSADCIPGVGLVGEACTFHDDCAATGGDPLCIDSFDYKWPGGYCSEYCDIMMNDCPAGSICVDPSPLGAPFESNGLGVCFKTCTKKLDCRDGYVCSDFGGGFVCVK